MRNYLPFKIFLVVLATILSLGESIAQCVSYPPNATVATPVSCRGGSDGGITITVVPGVSGFHSFLLQRYDIAQNKFIDVQGPIPTAATTYEFKGLIASRRYRVVTFDADEVECDEPVITSFIDVTQPAAALKISLVSKQDVENCFGDETGSISVSASGGNGGYEFTINGTDYFTAGTFKDLPAGDYTLGVKDAKGCTAQVPVTIAQPARLQLSLVSATDPACAGAASGSIVVAATGGTPGYQYSINGSVPTANATFSRPAGTYVVEVTDAKGCKAALPAVTLTDPATLTATINAKTDASCNGAADGSATVEALGGTAPYTFNWNTSPAQQTPTATDVPAGTYTVTVTDANGCTRTASVTIAQPAAVPAPTVASAAICEQETIPALTAAGTDILWYDNTDKLVATGASFRPGNEYTTVGTHTFYATQTVNGCESPKAAVSLTVKAIPNAPVAGSPAAICAGQDLPKLTASGSNITWYDASAVVLGTGPSFKPGDEYATAGTHTFYATQTVNGCESRSTAVTLTIHPAPAKPAITGTFSFCQSGNTQLTSSATSDNQWLLNGNPIGGATGQTFTVTAPGTYAVRVTNASNCAATSDPVTVPQTATPAAPAVTDVAYCQNATPAPLTAGGNDLRWYTTATSTDASNTPPAISTNTLGSTDYFVSQMVNGCESPRAKLTVTVHPNPAVPTISGNAAFCTGGNTVLTSSAATGNQWFLDGVLLNGATAQTLTVSAAGSYSVTVTSGACSASAAAFSVTRTNVTTPVISGTLTFCEGGSTILTSSASSGNQWNLNDRPILGQTGQTLTVAAAGNYSVTLTENGCSATSTAARVTVTAAPVTPTASSNGRVCAGGTINLTASAPQGVTYGQPVYAWSGPDGFSSSQQNPVIANAAPSASGTYSVVVTVNGCTSSPATVNVTVDPQVATPTISGNTTFCQGGNTVLTSSAVTGNQWFKDGAPIDRATAQTLIVSAAGSYSVTVTSGACSASAAAFNVTRTNVTTPTISGTLTFCEGGSTVLTASTSAGNRWLKDGVAVDGATGPALTVTVPGDYTVTITTGGCTAASAVAKVTATPVPAAPVASSNGPVCAGATLDLRATPANPVSNATYSWTGPNGFTSSQQAPSISNAAVTASGTYAVTITVAGCTSPAGTVNVTVNPVPAAPTISGNNAICPGATTVLTSSAATGNQWFKDGVRITGETAQTLTVATGGNYSVLVTSAAGCATTSAAFAVTQTSLAVPTISGNNTYCTGGSTVLTSSAATGNQWYKDGILIGGATAQALTAATPGDYSVVATANGCTATSALVKVTETPVPTAPVASNNGPICAGNTLQLMASAVAGAAYNWTGPNGFTATGQNVSVPNATAGHSGRYTVTVTAKGCSNAATVDVTVSPLPVTPTISGTATICADGNTLLTSSATSGNQWYKDGVLIGGATGQTLSVNAAGAYAVMVGNAAGCSATSRPFAVTQAATFTVNVTGTNPNGCTASNGTLSVTASPAGSYTYSLNGTNFSNTSGEFNGLGAGSHTVYVRSGAGCVVQATYLLTSGTLTASVAATGETACNAADGTITLTPAGGSGSYTYAFRLGSTGNYNNMERVNTLTGREPGTYFLRVSDDRTACTFETTAMVTRFDCNAPVCTLTATHTVTQPTCSNPNGSIVLTASGGTAPYTYSRDGIAFGSSNVQPAPANTYSQVTVRDAANCVYILPAITLSAPTQPSAPVAANPAPVCAGGDAPQLTASGSGLQWYSDAGLTDRVGIGSPFIPAMNTAAAGTTSFYVTQTVNGCQSPAATVAVAVSVPANFSLSKTDPTGCATTDGTITVTDVTGGAGTYQYSLDGTTYQAGATFSGRGAGNYTVYVKDANNCVATQSVQLATPDGFTATVTPANETGCDAKDGMIRVTGLPANAAGYHYFLDGDLNWAGAGIPVFTGLEPRTYTVRVEAQTPDKCSYTTIIAVGTDCVRGCVITASVIDKTDPACPGGTDGSLTLGASGGSGMYEYSKDGISFQDASTFDGLNAGDYTITVRDKQNSSCGFVLNGIALSDPDLLTANAQPSQPTCVGNDGSLAVTAIGGSGTYNYSLEDDNGVVTTNATGAFADLVAGSYTVTVRDDRGCTITLNPVTLTAAPALTASVSGTNPTACGTDNGTITVNNATGGTGPYSYSLDGHVYQSDNTFSGRPAGSYTVYVRDSKRCVITRTQTLVAPGGITATTGWTDETACTAADGTITVTGVTGATGPFTYFQGTVRDDDGVFTNLQPGTYTIRVVAVNNCQYTTTVTIGTACTNPPACTLTATSSKTDPTCANPNGSFTVTVTGGTAPYQYFIEGDLVDGVSSSTALFNRPAGNYNITVQDDAGCTFSLNTIALVAPAVPAAPAATTPAPVCPAETLPTLTATGDGIRWYDANNRVVATTNDFTPTMSNPAPGTYSYFATRTVDGCESARTTVTITIKAQPAAPAVTDVAYCQNATPAPLTAGGNDLRWYLVATGGNGTIAPPTVQTQTAGVTDYFVSQIVNGCESPRAKLTVTVHPNPAVPTISGNAAFCTGGNTVLTSSAATGNQWFKDGVLLSEATAQALTVTQTGRYWVGVTNANGCSATSAALAVTRTTVTAPTISGRLSFCQDGSTILTSSAATGNQWNLNDRPILGQTGQTLTVTDAGNYSVTFTQDGCSATSTAARVSITPAPVAPTASSNGRVCVGSTIELLASLLEGATYNWTGPNGFASTLRNPMINAATAAASGTYSVTVTVDGCTSPAATVNVTVNPAFDFTLSGTAPTGCGTRDGRLTVTPSVAGSYQYQVNDEAPSASSEVLNNRPAGTYTVSLMNDAGCVVQKTYQLAGPGGFTATAVSTNERACGAQDGTITVTAAPAGANYEYAIRLPGKTTYESASRAASFPNLGPGTYRVRVTDGNGCEFVVSATVTAFTCPPVCTLTAQVSGTTDPTCANPDGGAVAVTVSGGTAPYQYYVNGVLGGIEKLSGLGAGTHTIRVTDNAGCRYSLPAVTLTAPGGPAAPVVSASNASVCTGASINLNANSPRAGATFQWTGPNGFTATGGEVIIRNATAAASGTYAATVTVDGCVSPAATVEVTVKPAVAAPAVADVTYCVGVQATALTATGTDLKWYNAATGGNPLATAPVPSTTAAGQQEYYVSQTVNDCESPRAKVTVTVRPSTDAACACNFTAFAASHPVSCRDDQDGTAIAVVQAGGSGKYLYRLLNSTAAPQDLEQFFAEFQNQLRGPFSIEITDKVTGCKRTVSQEIGAKVLWLASVNAKEPTCAGNDGKIEIAAIATGPGKGTAPFVEKLYKDGELLATQTTETGEALFENLLPGTYRVEVTDATPCTFVQEVTITGGEPLKVTAAVTTQPLACSTNDGEITLTVTGGKAPYEYRVNDEPRTDITAGKIGRLLAGDYRIIVKDANGCEATVTVALKVDPIVFTVQSGEATCEKPTATVRAVIEEPTGYKFSINGVDYLDSPVFEVSPGEYTMHVRRTASTSCPVTRKFTVTGVGAIDFNVSQVNVGCTGGAEGSITVSGITGGRLNGGEADYGITLYRGDKLIATRYTGEEALTFGELAPDTYRVVLEYGNGCRTAAREVVISSSGIPFSVLTTPATCGSPSGSAEAVVGAAGRKYFYSINNTNFFEAPLFTNLKPGEYKMYIRESAEDLCANVLPFVIGGPDSLKAKVRRENCNDIVLSPITGGVRPYRISVDGGKSFVSGNLFRGSYVVSNLPDGNYEVIVADNQDCRTFPVKVRINNTLAAKVKATLSMPDEPTGAIQIADIRGGDGPYEVSLNGTDWARVKDTSIPYDTTITGQGIGDYIVYVRDANGCVKVYPVEVKESTFLIPNVFTPNNDGINDTFFIRNLPTSTLVRIVNRWGKVVFESSNYQNDWNGGEYPDGIYYYTVNIAGKGTFSGWVQIWR